MITSFLNNLIAFIASVPINLIIIGVVCLILKMMGRPFSTIVRAFTGYFLLCFLFSLFGLTMPSIPAIFNWCKDVLFMIINYLKAAGIW